ncbi:FHA domain-containing protein [Streptomyces sp. S3(2020)]|uniref:FHA domain-containing protein n=1 Tax=Streptomyces sp. S3(2020) TaxID=2732044 RepID=UPI001488FE1A|nr:FHA domain-containing protein [Streptomyces sp. S3(2020)]NNN36994.1 FHA domain-containing protein [Streptomyces sp. S3(2020)]
MQIRLTVVDPLGPPVEAHVRAAGCDVLVTAPAGTALASISSALASAVSGDGALASGTGQPVLYAGAERLDAQRCTLGEPPLTDGAVLSLGAPTDPEPHPEVADAPTRLDVVAGPDAGGVHLLHGGRIEIGRSADADVPLDDPDVSRLHCAVTVASDGRVSVADLDSTNGTALDGIRVGTRPVRFAPGALLRVGESALRLAPPGGPGARLRTTPDGEGHVRVAPPTETGTGSGAPSGPTRYAYGTADLSAAPGQADEEQPVVPGQGQAPRIESRGARAYEAKGPVSRRRVSGVAGRSGAAGGGETHGGRLGAGGSEAGFGNPATASGTASDDRAAASGHPGPGGTPASGGLPRGGPAHPRGTAASGGSFGSGDTRAPGGTSGSHSGPPDSTQASPATGSASDAEHTRATDPPAGSRRKGTPLRGTDVPQGVRKRGGLGAWARKLTGGRGEQSAEAGSEAYDEEVADTPPVPSAVTPQQPETWPDPAALLLTALGPGPRLWERGPDHPEALTVRLGTADRAAPDGSGLLPAVPVTADLREGGALGLAGPRARLAGLARAVVAQLAALHSPDALEIVLISADRSRPLAERTAEWSWLGWLPHLRPAHGQDCRLLVAYDREQATARTDELLRRLDETPQTSQTPQASQTAGSGGRPGRPTQGPGGTGIADRDRDRERTAPRAGTGSDGRGTIPAETRGATRGATRRPSWARDDDGTDKAPGFEGPYTVLLVDSDPGGADVREAVARLALEGPRAGIHVVCLAETAPASPASPVTETYETACAASPAFRECGAVALLSGDVATALRLLRVAQGGAPGSDATVVLDSGNTLAPGRTSGPVDETPAGHPVSQAHTTGPVGHGTVAAVDAVSPAWAERFARALAPLRTDGAGGERQPRVSAPLPQMARLLDELGLARATPASLMTRWADAADDTEALGGRAWAVLGAGPRGPVCADLVADGPHLLIEGPAGSGRTELLRAVVASLAAAERPDRLSIVLMDGRDSVGTGGGGHGEGLRVCTDVPHVTTHLTANDPVRMREFAQSLSAELKRRAELLGRSDFAEWHTGRELSGRMVAQRGSSGGAGDLDAPPSSTIRLRPAAARQQTESAPPLPRLVVVVDDLDALVSPALGSPGRPSAGSVMRALEAVAREGDRLGVHLVAAATSGGRTAESDAARRAALRVTLDAPAPGPDEPAPGRGHLSFADGRVTPLQGGRVTGRIPRTATLRPTVVPLDWHRMGDPPTRRPVRELGNGPTDLALLASALERAAREVAATEVPSLL